MLKKLHIRNYALIDELEIDFSDKLTIITGETGAGKSILLGALGMIMGERADTKIFYREGEKCVVEGTFLVKKYDLGTFFEENELDYDDEVVIRRELTTSGKSRAFINDTPVSNKVLEQLTAALIDLHQQFDTLDIHNVNFQLRMIDALAENRQILSDYQSGFRQFVSEKKRLDKLLAQQESASRETDFLQFQLDEFNKAALMDGEQAAQESEMTRLSNAEDIKTAFGAAFNQLSEAENAIVPQLKDLARSLAAMRRLDKSLATIAERLDAQVIDLQELAKDCEAIAEDTDHDPQRILEIQQRLDIIYRLQKKHGVGSVEELMQIQDTLASKLGNFTDLADEIVTVEQNLAALDKRLRAIGSTLTERRKSVVDGFETKVQHLLTQLSMPHARLKVAVEATENLTPTGCDAVEFLFATNVGSKFLPIKNVASGGELSRLNLCTKSIVADAIPLPTLIFDEIDSGISGDVALKMGLILRELSGRHQVIAITHTPQVAARANCHYFIYKKTEGDRTATNVKMLAPDERVRAVATMLSGNPPSVNALETARELLAG
jgi:DNA repair protein RecN (Recombination protein N)